MISTKTRIARSLGISKKKTVFLRPDFESFGTSTRVTRALQELITEGRIIRVGTGNIRQGTTKQCHREPGSCCRPSRLSLTRP